MLWFFVIQLTYNTSLYAVKLCSIYFLLRAWSWIRLNLHQPQCWLCLDHLLTQTQLDLILELDLDSLDDSTVPISVHTNLQTLCIGYMFSIYCIHLNQWFRVCLYVGRHKLFKWKSLLLDPDLPCDVFNKDGGIWGIELHRKPKAPGSNCGQITDNTHLMLFLWGSACSLK